MAFCKRDDLSGDHGGNDGVLHRANSRRRIEFHLKLLAFVVDGLQSFVQSAKLRPHHTRRRSTSGQTTRPVFFGFPDRSRPAEPGRRAVRLSIADPLFRDLANDRPRRSPAPGVRQYLFAARPSGPQSRLAAAKVSRSVALATAPLAIDLTSRIRAFNASQFLYQSGVSGIRFHGRIGVQRRLGLGRRRLAGRELRLERRLRLPEFARSAEPLRSAIPRTAARRAAP